MNPQVSILSNLRVAGAIVLDKDSADFPNPASPGMFVLKGDTLYVYTTVNGLKAWFPLIRAASATYLHMQGGASDVWTVNHNLDSIHIWYQIQDDAGNVVSAMSYEEVSANTFKLHFTEAITGNVLVVASNNIDVPAIQTTLLEVGSAVRIDNSGIYINDVAVTTSINSLKIGNGTAQQMEIEAGGRLDIVGTGRASVSYNDPANKLTIDVPNLTNNDIKTALGYTPIDAAKIGVLNGLAPLGPDALIPAVYLPSYVDDVIEVDTKALLPATGSKGVIYLVDADESDSGKTNQYRWGGSAYIKIVQSPSSTDAVAEGTTNLYFTQARVRATSLTGLSTATGGVITAADTVLQAVGKLQAQITTNAAAPVSFVGVPYDLAGACSGKPSASATIAGFIIARACNIPAGMTLSVARTTTAPTTNAVFNIKKNGTLVGTLTFQAAQNTGVFAAASAISLAVGDLLDVVAPSTQDSTLADVRLTIATTLA